MSLATNNDEDDDDQPYILAALESIKTALAIEFTPVEERHKLSFPGQRREALLNRAMCERRLKKPEEAILSYEAAKAELPTYTMRGMDLFKWTNLLNDEQLMETLPRWTLWDRMSWLTYDTYNDDRDEFEDQDSWFTDPNERFQRAAKDLDKLPFLIETYEQIIAYKIASKQAGMPRLELAQVYARTMNDTEKAKAVLYEIMDSDTVLDVLGEDDADTGK